VSARLHAVPHQREIVDRRAVAARLEGADRAGCAAILKEALADGRAEIARRLADKPWAGMEAAAAYAFLTDQILRLAYDFVTTRLHPLANPTTSERLLLMAVGGYGRGEMALHSDVDIAFVTPYKSTGWTETVIETILYLLWDLGLRVGHSTRSADELNRVATADQTVRTAILEARYVWGDEALYDLVAARFWKEVVVGHGEAAPVEQEALELAWPAPEGGKAETPAAPGELLVEMGEEQAGEVADDLRVQEVMAHEALDRALPRPVGIVHPRRDLALIVEGQPFLGAACDEMEMAAHRP
jgi:[protein-PII] uridylyltransferase